ncbi:MAG: hypothetical protein GY854_17025 [Deltaproteobacteria bacterium]|nr:hypothetical protein [Deltaproteobacteria bacterium]
MFGQKLEGAVASVGGSEAAILMGLDGIQVDAFCASKELDIETVGMEFSVLLKEVRKAADLLEAGDAEEMTVRTEKMVTVLRIVNENYFVALVLSTDGNLGKARYTLRVLAPEMAKDLE